MSLPRLNSSRDLFHAEPQPLHSQRQTLLQSTDQLSCHERISSLGSSLSSCSNSTARVVPNRMRAISTPTSIAGLQTDSSNCLYPPPPNFEDGSSKLRVLVVDDNILNLRVMKRLLMSKLRGWIDFDQLKLVSSGEDALAQFGITADSAEEEGDERVFSCNNSSDSSNSPFDLVLLDISMPGMNGIEVCNRLRQTFGPDQLHICAVTTDLEDWQVELYREANMNGVVGKPLKIHDLEYALRKSYQRIPDQQFYFCLLGSLKEISSSKENSFITSDVDDQSSDKVAPEWAKSDRKSCMNYFRKVSVIKEGSTVQNIKSRPATLMRLDSQLSISTIDTESTFPIEAIGSTTTTAFANKLGQLDLNLPIRKLLVVENGKEDDGSDECLIFDSFLPQIPKDRPPKQFEESALTLKLKEQDELYLKLRRSNSLPEKTEILSSLKSETSSKEDEKTDGEPKLGDHWMKKKRLKRFSNPVRPSWQLIQLTITSQSLVEQETLLYLKEFMLLISLNLDK